MSIQEHWKNKRMKKRLRIFYEKINTQIFLILILYGLRDYIKAVKIAFLNYYDHNRKLLVIFGILDAQRVLVDGLKNFPRVIYPLKRLKLTRIKLPKVLRGARTGTVAAAAKEFNLDEAWSKTSFAKRFDADKKRSATTDFDRFKIMVLRKQRSFAAKTKNAKAGGKAPAKAAPKAAAKKK